MSLLIDIGLPEWMQNEALRDLLSPQLPGVTIHCGTPGASMPDVTMVAVAGGVPDVWNLLPNLRLVQKLGAGVDAIVSDPKMPGHVRVTRMAPEIQAREIAEYCLGSVLLYQRRFFDYRDLSRAREWRPVPPRLTSETVVAVLGLGHIGRRVATLFSSMGFRVTGWSRRQRSVDGVTCHCGDVGLWHAIEDSDYIVGVLPSTPRTRNLFNRSFFSESKRGAVLINVGRGDQVVEDELIDALDAGELGGAVLDVTRTEPLPPDSPLWKHDHVLVTPHVAGWHITEGLADVAENYRRLTAGEALLHEVDRAAGY